MKLDTITNKTEITGLINPNDEFYTPNYAINPLLKYLKPNSKICCPFDSKKSNFYRLLTQGGHTVKATHVWDDQFSNDFFDLSNEYLSQFDYIISNPPYSIKYEVFKRLFEIGKPFAMLVGVVGLFESDKRFTIFSKNSFEIMYLNKRVSYFKSYDDQKPSLNPPFSSVYICSGILSKQIMFERISK